ncbi:MAG: trypsin-like peptidase domain-containing protein, partial [Bacteroidia bacterium]|nr:trypsin-like peptidase domain-containing protein [Bacteroidia bacterium]
MKRLFPLIFAGFIGGLMAIVAVQFMNNETQYVSLQNQSPRAVLANNPTAPAPFDFVEAAEKVTPAVVHISALESRELAQQRYQDQQQNRRSPFGEFFDMWDMDDFFGRNFFQPKNGTGSGVIVSEDGYIVTNNHVVEYADIIKVSLSDKREFTAVKIGTDPSTDLALLKIEARNLKSVQFADSDEVKVGEWVAAIGNPFSYLTSTVTAGIVSAKGRDIDIIRGEKTIEEFIQTDAAINPGNSGGALVSAEGDLIGINTAIATPTGVYAGYSFAIPSNLVKRVIKDIKENGNIERGRLGVQGNTVDEEIINEFGLQIDYGFYIVKVDKGSAAQFAGVLPGDIIIEINRKKVREFDDLYSEMEFAKV